MEYVILPIIGVFLAFSALLGLVFSLHRTNDLFKNGIIEYYFYAILLSTAVTMALSPRDFITEGQYFTSAIENNPIAEWATRIASLVTLFAAIERTFHYFRNNKFESSRLIMLAVLTYFWITNLFIPLFITAHQSLSLQNFYSLILSIGIAFTLHQQPIKIIHQARNAFTLFVLLSVLFIFINPTSALELNYIQGYIPGLPRFYGLAPHATTMGMIVALALWLIVAYPYQNSKMQFIFIIIFLFALALTQSKTIIFSFLAGLFFIIHYQAKHEKINAINTNKFINYNILNKFYLSIFLFLSLILIVFVFSDYQSIIYRYVNPTTVYNITSFTGRDLIWEIALDEFNKSPIFGYGIGLFSESYRLSIGMINATDGHNQFIDTLARSGLIGFSGLIILYSYLVFYSIKIAKLTNGLSLSLLFLLLINSITAVPVGLYGIGLAYISYYLLIFLIAAYIQESNKQSSEKMSNV